MMSHQQLFEPVLTGEPPARDTLDALVRRSRRRVRYRRLAGTGAGLAATGLAGVLLLPAGSPVVTGAPPIASPSTLDRQGNALLGVDPVEPLAAAVDRLAAAVQAAVMQAVPGARITGRPAVERKIVLAAVGSLDRTYGYVVTAEVTAGGVRGVLRVDMVRQSAEPTACLPTPAPDLLPPASPSFMAFRCVPPSTPPYTTDTVVDERPGMIRHVARADRADGSTVTVSISNEPALTGQPPLTGAQAAQLAGDPRLALYP